jgi:hypothetical protein
VSTDSWCATVGRTLSTLRTFRAWGIRLTLTDLALSFVLELFLFLFLFCQLFLPLFVTVVGSCQVMLSGNYNDFNILLMGSGTAWRVLSLICPTRLGWLIVPAHGSTVGMPAGMTQPGSDQNKPKTQGP